MFNNWNQLEQFLNQRVLGNKVENILWFAGILLFGLLLRKVFALLLSKILFRLIKKESENLPLTDFLKLLRRPVEMLILLIIVYTAFSVLRYPPQWHLVPSSRFGLRMIVLKLYQVLMIISMTWIVMNALSFFILVLGRRASSRVSPLLNEQLLPFLKEVVKVFLVIFSFIIALKVIFRLDVGSIIAGLGIGGLAVALAAKESLENLFASFTIFLDRPFIAGDMVQVGNIQGTIEKVGFRSTRIRTLDKSFLTVPNKMMIDQALDNLTQRKLRRARFMVNLTYDTTSEQIKAICEDIRELLANHEMTKAEKSFVWFSEFGESSLNILILYFASTPDWAEFNAVKEEVNFKIIQAVEKHGATFAFPTRTLHIHHEPVVIPSNGKNGVHKEGI